MLGTFARSRKLSFGVSAAVSRDTYHSGVLIG